MISFIVSAYDRPEMLRCCLASLRCQTTRNAQLIVCDNSWDSRNLGVANEFGAVLIQTWQNGNTCYHGLEAMPGCEWLCFPSDDSYYVPHFSRIMLAAAQRHGWEFVYCDMVYDGRLAQRRGAVDEYSVLAQEPRLGMIDKTGFLVTRRAFEAVGGWPKHPTDCRDGALAEALVKAGVKHGKVPGVMVVHN